MRLNVISYEGRPYLEKTLASVNGNAKIFHQYFNNPLEMEGYEIVNNFVYKTPARIAASWNYATMLEKGDLWGDWLIALEDDVVLCSDFEKRLNSVIKTVPQTSVTALYSCYDWGAGRLDAVPYPPETFYGTQAMIFSSDAAKRISDYIFKKMLGMHNYDLVLGKACAEFGIPLYASRRSLAQHIGEVSTGQSASFHRAFNFIDVVLPLKKK